MSLHVILDNKICFVLVKKIVHNCLLCNIFWNFPCWSQVCLLAITAVQYFLQITSYILLHTCGNTLSAFCALSGWPPENQTQRQRNSHLGCIHYSLCTTSPNLFTTLCLSQTRQDSPVANSTSKFICFSNFKPYISNKPIMLFIKSFNHIY